MLYLSLFYDSDISLIDNGLKMEDMKVAATITNHIPSNDFCNLLRLARG